MGGAQARGVGVIRVAEDRDIGVFLGNLVGVDARDVDDHEVGRIDDAFVQALTGGVYAVRDGRSLVVRSLDGWSSSGLHEPDEAAQWLADAVDGRRTEGVLAGASWV